MKTYKRALSLIMVLAIMFSLMACSGSASSMEGETESRAEKKAASSTESLDNSKSEKDSNNIAITDNRKKASSEDADKDEEEKAVSELPVLDGNNELPAQSKESGSKVYEAFSAATSLELEDLSMDDTGGYWYKGIRLSADDAVIDIYPVSTGGLNGFEYKEKFICAQSAMYNGIALEMARICANDGALYSLADDSFFEILLDSEKPDSFDEFKDIANSLGKFIVYNPTMREIFSAFEPLSCVEGRIDSDTINYKFVIKDLKQAAKELNISEEMLGYALAYTTIYLPKFTWGDNSVEIEYLWGTSYCSISDIPLKSFNTDSQSLINGDEFDICCGDAAYNIYNIASKLNSSLRFLQGDAEDFYLYDKGNTDYAVAHISFSNHLDDKDELKVRDDFTMCYAYMSFANEDYSNIVVTLLSVIMAIDPNISLDDAKDIGTEITSDMMEKNSMYSVSGVERDGLLIALIRSGAEECLLNIAIKSN